MNNKVSLVVPIYNTSLYLKKCIESLVNQSYKNIEIILVDDGSNDDSFDRMLDFEKNDKRIIAFSKKNGGLSDARNYGLEKATGEYVCFIDSDDYISKDMILILMKEANENNSDVVVCSYYDEKLSIDGKVIESKRFDYSTEDIESMSSIVGYAWNKLYKKDFLLENKITFTKGLSLIEDVTFNEKVYANTDKITYVPLALYYYVNRQRPSLIKKYYPEAFELQKKGHKSRENILKKEFEFLDNFKVALSLMYINGIRYSISNMFVFKNELTDKQKIFEIKKIVSDQQTQKVIDDYKPKNALDTLFKVIVKRKLYIFMWILYKVKYDVRRNEINETAL